MLRGNLTTTTASALPSPLRTRRRDSCPMILPGSSYTQGMQGAYATGTAVSTEVVREAVDLMDKKCAEVARTDAQDI